MPNETPHEVFYDEDVERREETKLIRTIILISFICFCLPGVIDSTVAANATVALLSTTAVMALFFVGPVLALVGPRIAFLIEGWTYTLHSGSLLNFNHSANGAFVIAAGAVLGIGSSLIWVVQGAIMTTYVHESQKGRAIAIFWIIFNVGGGVGSLAAFCLNFLSTTGTVNDATYLHATTETENRSVRGILDMAVATLCNWRVQNDVNGMKFNIRISSLNGALYWLTQMFGGLLIGLLLDLSMLERPGRACLDWQFQKWQDTQHAQGHVQDIDYTQGSISTEPILLYIFYGAYDSLWQSYYYWLMSTQPNSTGRAAVLVGTYKAFQAAGGAMAWRINAQQTSAMTQLAMDWGLSIGSLVLALPTVLAVTKSTSVPEEAGAGVPSDKIEEETVDKL
ncbi:hypothetical protein LZ32DRAFT_634999 [Colletotrichum eremochloae]|nr:hypothetical protein LZ32DRAFT_634999 [Colletotrichum eremochloae]